jgi:hypothetical protein
MKRNTLGDEIVFPILPHTVYWISFAAHMLLFPLGEGGYGKKPTQFAQSCQMKQGHSHLVAVKCAFSEILTTKPNGSRNSLQLTDRRLRDTTGNGSQKRAVSLRSIEFPGAYLWSRFQRIMFNLQTSFAGGSNRGVIQHSQTCY